MASLHITLTRSAIGSNPKQKKTLEALGLKKMNQTVVKEDNPATRGMITVVSHLVNVEEK